MDAQFRDVEFGGRARVTLGPSCAWEHCGTALPAVEGPRPVCDCERHSIISARVFSSRLPATARKELKELVPEPILATRQLLGARAVGSMIHVYELHVYMHVHVLYQVAI